jgi:hypothetical protein
MHKLLKRVPFELVFWVVALVLLATSDPHSHGDGTHFTLCPLANMGFSWCPGCGIGRSITQLFHGNLEASFARHWFGLPALLIIFRRIMVLTRMILTNNKRLNLKYKEERYV